MKIMLMVLFAFASVSAQENMADTILEELKTNFDRIEDYQVDVTLEVDVEFLEVPTSEATIYFKKPDQTHVESEGFALIPKEGLRFNPNTLMENESTNFYVRQDTVNGRALDVLKLIPINDKSQIMLSSIWVDRERMVVRKVESTTRINGTFTIDLEYDNNIAYPLPSSMVFTFDLRSMDFARRFQPESVDPPGAPDEDGEKPAPKENKTGMVKIVYDNYTVNQGIPDSVFEKKKPAGKN